MSGGCVVNYVAFSLQNLLENMDVKKLSLLKELGLDSLERKLCTDAGGEKKKQGTTPGQLSSQKCIPSNKSA